MFKNSGNFGEGERSQPDNGLGNGSGLAIKNMADKTIAFDQAASDASNQILSRIPDRLYRAAIDQWLPTPVVFKTDAWTKTFDLKLESIVALTIIGARPFDAPVPSSRKSLIHLITLMRSGGEMANFTLALIARVPNLLLVPSSFEPLLIQLGEVAKGSGKLLELAQIIGKNSLLRSHIQDNSMLAERMIELFMSQVNTRGLGTLLRDWKFRGVSSVTDKVKKSVPAVLGVRGWVPRIATTASRGQRAGFMKVLQTPLSDLLKSR